MGLLIIDGSNRVSSIVDEGIGKVRINFCKPIINPHFSPNSEQGIVYVLDRGDSFVLMQTSLNNQEEIYRLILQ